MSRTVRIVLIVLGLASVLGGLFAWSNEDEYGSGLDYSTKPSDGRIEVFGAIIAAGAILVIVGALLVRRAEPPREGSRPSPS